MAIPTIPSIATEVRPLFAGRFGPLWYVEFTGLGRPLAASGLPTSLQIAVGPAASSPPPTYSVHRLLQVAHSAIGTTVNRSV
jgi:hypothetical protein